jgi:cephalosporin-C deacetylase-like acetyl esterase
LLLLLAGAGVTILATSDSRAADEKPLGTLAVQLSRLETNVFPPDGDKAKELAQMLSLDVRARRDAANKKSIEDWQKVASRADWERFRDGRIQALRASLGQFPAPPKDLKVRVTKTIDGDGYKIENVLYESRPGVTVTGNLYSPKVPGKSMPGILIIHSHHTPKAHGELQDMGVNWARLGCLVLVIDQLGHGERRQHPFVDEKSYPGTFRPSRQDYYFRYNSAAQLHTIGDSLVGWMAWDMMRGVDLLLTRPGIDKDRIILLGSVAGGGDPAAVTAAIDPRIAAAAIFNFGGPQPETTFPLPPDAARSFNYVGSGSWESTRNLRLSARDGFLPWVIVGSLAPRRLIYAHEFAWDRDRDPVWAMLQKIYGFYNGPDAGLSSVAGRGSVRGKAGPDNTHCTHIGAVHRKPIYPALKRWFNMPEPEKEVQDRRPGEELLCLTAEARAQLRPLHELAAEIGAERAAEARKRLPEQPEARRQELCKAWARLLGEVEPKGEARVTEQVKSSQGEVTVERLALEVEPRIVIPLVLLTPRQGSAKRPVVVAFAQQGKKEFLARRSEAVAELLGGGVAVCLPDLRGCGETRPGGDSRGRTSTSTSLSASELMLGQTLLGSRLRDLRSVVRYLCSRPDLDAGRLALWGDSFAPVNLPDRNLQVPWDADKLPLQSEPLGGLLALFGALFEDGVKAAYGQGGLAGYQSLLVSPFLYVPHDAVVPGALTAGDLGDVAAALAPRPVRLEGLVDGLNRRVAPDMAAKAFEPARTTYQAAKAADRLQIVVEPGKESPARWLLAQLK